jgi:uncharacterized protein (TIGR02757 family)
MEEILTLLEVKYQLYNTRRFIKTDPVSIPHRYKRKEDIEISGLLTALISWGNRKSILNSADRIMSYLENEPFNFITTASVNEFRRFNHFVYRTFNSDDLLFMIYALRNIYLEEGGLEPVALSSFNKNGEIETVISGLRNALLKTEHLKRSEKHLANPENGSAAKRINMFLRWMVREDKSNVDFGIWKQIPSSALMCPLDIHSGNVARKLGLLGRKQNDWKAVEELTDKLRKFDKNDPVKYDFALFGMGVFEGWGK